MSHEKAAYDKSNVIQTPEKPIDSPLRQYITSFGIDPIKELFPQDIVVFSAAKKLERFIDDITIKTARKRAPEQKTIKVERLVEEQIQHTSYIEGEEISRTPADSMDVGQIQNPTDLPEILPAQWVEAEVAPDYFVKKLLEKRLLKRVWIEKTRKPVISFETVQKKKMVEEPAPPEDEKRFAYVLLDKSGSMNRGGKQIAGKSLALAFLRKGKIERSELYFRAFNYIPEEMHEGKTDEGFKKLALKILRTDNDGDTDIQLALEKAVEDINSGGKFAYADILLITDGLSRLENNPLGKVKLHTVRLAQSDKDLFESEETQLKKLKAWSKNYKLVDPSEFQDEHTKPEEEKELEIEVLKSLPDRFSKPKSLSELKKLMQSRGHIEDALQYGQSVKGSSALTSEQLIDLDDIISQLNDLRDSSAMQKHIEEYEQQQKIKESNEAKKKRRLERIRKKQEAETEQILKQLEELTEKIPNVEIPSEPVSPRSNSSTTVHESPEELLNKLKQLTNTESSVDYPEETKTASNNPNQKSNIIQTIANWIKKRFGR